MVAPNYLILRDEITVEELVTTMYGEANFNVLEDNLKVLFKKGYGFINIIKANTAIKHSIRFVVVETSKNIFNIYAIDFDMFKRGDKANLLILLEDKCGFTKKELAEFFDASSDSITRASWNKRNLTSGTKQLKTGITENANTLS